MRKYYRLNDWKDASKYENVFFKGNKYSVAYKALNRYPNLFNIFDFLDYDYGTDDSEFDTFEDSVEFYFKHLFEVILFGYPRLKNLLFYENT